MFDLAGQTLGKYRLVEKLGQGGMAQVYKAYQPDLDRYVAVKILHPHLTDDPEFEARFRREARAIASLEHPNIVRVYDFDTDRGLAFLVMEYLEGASLKRQLHDLHCRQERMDVAAAARLVATLADALDYAHRQGVIHRDLKPSNVVITLNGRPALVDFGIARMIDVTAVTESGGTLGTPAYMSPEQGQGQPGDARSDVYALGVILYQLCTGRVPFDADTPYAIILKHITAPLPPPRTLRPDLPEPVERVILKALAKEPAGRFQSAGDLRAALSDLRLPEGNYPAAGPRGMAGPLTGRGQDRPRPKEIIDRQSKIVNRKSLAVVLALVAVLLVGAVLVVLARLPWRASAAQIAPGGASVLVVQGPELVQDTWLDPDMPDEHWNQADLVHLQGPLTPDRVVLRFDVPAATLPAGGRVVSATLTLKVELWGDQSLPGAAVAYRVLVPWDAAAASYNAPWSTPGLTAGWDYDPTPLDVVDVPDAGLLSFDVTQAAAAWLERGQPNYGLVVMMAAGSHNQAHHWVYLSEQPDSADRPTLRIAVREGP